jgi:2,4-dienoyl-CoA reductase-like NADH-dependent reductase (Old Yellow Enzyme family)
MSRPFIIEPDIVRKLQDGRPDGFPLHQLQLLRHHDRAGAAQVPVRKAAEAVRGLWQLPQGGFCL